MLDFIHVDHHKILRATRNLNHNKAHANILPIHKKQSRQLIKKLQTNFFVTYLWKKLPEKLIFNYIY